MAEGGFRVTLIGEYSASYEVFSSTDLVNWTLADLLTNPYGTCQFTDLAATNFSRRFYRALKQP